MSEYIPNSKGRIFSRKISTRLFDGRCFSWFRMVVSDRPESKDFKILYHCPIDKTVVKRKMFSYLKWLEKLTTIKLNYFITKETIYFEVHLSNPHTFFLLTAIRYVNEFPEIINYLPTNFKSVNEFLSELYNAHLNHYNLGSKAKYFNTGGHGFIAPMYFTLGNVIKTQRKFKRKRSLRAQDYLCA